MNELGVSKKLLYPGKLVKGTSPLNYPKETKFFFHYKIVRFEHLDEPVVIDDTKKYGKVMELYTAKQFQLEVWETCLETMQVGEVASFTVDKKHLRSFGPINKKLRDYMLNKHEAGQVKHCCGMMTMQEQGGLGYPDLDVLMERPESLEFVFELVDVHLPGEKEKETWAMSADEKSVNVSTLKERGNLQFKENKYSEARISYGTALELLEQLCLREKPGEKEWTDLDERKIPLLLNLCQTEIMLHDYYRAIEHATEAIKKDPNNIKAHFRRAKAHLEVWNLDEAKLDFEKVVQFNPGMQKVVAENLEVLRVKRQEKRDSDRELYKNKLLT